MTRVDAFAHVLPPKFYQRMLDIDQGIPEKLPFIKHPLLQNQSDKRQYWDGQTKEIISSVNINPEDYTRPELAYQMCRVGNEELIAMVKQNTDMVYACLAMLPMNHLNGALELLKQQVLKEKEMVGIQLFTQALGKSIADSEFERIFTFCHDHDIPIWLHPVFDERKPDNNILFSWEYELSQAMPCLTS